MRLPRKHIRKDDKVSALSNRKNKDSNKWMDEQGPLNDNTPIKKKKSKIKEQSWAKMNEKDTKSSVQEITLVEKDHDKLKTVIHCENQGHGNGNRILINALAQVTPCCFLNGYFHHPYNHNKNTENINKPPFSFFEDPILAKLFHKHKNNQNDLTAISLEHHTLKEILEGDFFADIQDSWTTKDPIERCLEVCDEMY